MPTRFLRRLGIERLPHSVTAAVGAAALAVAVVAIARSVDGDALATSGRAMLGDPGGVLLALAAFGLAFVLRAAVWTRVLPTLPFRQALAGIHLALGANHVLPLRLGEPFRVVSVVRRRAAGLEEATASTVALRAADILAVLVIGAVLGPGLFARLVGPWGLAVFAVVAAVGAVGLVWLVRMRRGGARAAGGRPRHGDIRLPGPVVAAGSLLAWLAEAVLVWQSARFTGIPLSYGDALLVTTVAVAAQTVAIAPSGIGTYEAASVAAYAALGHDPGTALAAAIVAHALKTAYSLVAGAVAVVWPAPSLLGRVRLPAPAGGTAVGATAPPPGTAGDGDADEGATTGGADAVRPVVLFLPAHDEEATVGAVVRRTPATVAGHPVVCMVIDDGSADATAERAAAAGAEVVSLGRNHGLGAGVRRGFAEALARDAVAVAFCDADGEYAPEELERLVAPILAGTADYVVGSRFAGTIETMRPHRRVGNLVLTRALSFIARRPISDGQSGYRALSAAAAAHAEIIHDFNYAQVLTLDLLAKGYRYAEVPISYRFRTEGRSFVRLGRYLRHVGPAVWRVVNRPDPAVA